MKISKRAGTNIPEVKDAREIHSVDEFLLSVRLRKGMLIEKISRPGKKAAGSADRLKAQTLDRDLLAGGAYERVPLQKL